MTTSGKEPAPPDTTFGRGMPLLPQHNLLIANSSISPAVASARGYWSAMVPEDLAHLGFSKAQRLVPALVVPVYGVNGTVALHQLRPDHPRLRNGKPLKYETPAGARMALDVPPGVHHLLGDPNTPLWLTEGVRKADSAVSRGLCCIDLLGVWNWRGTNQLGGKTALADWDSIALNGRRIYLVFDSDALDKKQVRGALERLAAYLASRDAQVQILRLPPDKNGAKVGLDDYFAAGGTFEALLQSPWRTEEPRQASEFITDLGISRRFVERHGEDLRFVRTFGTWFIWDGARWRPDDTGEVLDRCAKVARDVTLDAEKGGDAKVQAAARRQEQAPRLLGALQISAADRRVAVRAEDLDRDPWLLNCTNGVVELRTGKLRPHAREDLITRLVPHAFRPDAKCERWLKFLSEVTAERTELVDFLRRFIGYCLTAETREHALVLAVGPGGNGKSVYVETLVLLLGPDFATPAPPGLLLVQKGERHPTELMDLRARRLVVASELPKGATFSEERVKWLTGGDSLKGRGMRENFTTFAPTHKLIVCANHMPRVRDNSAGFWRRLRVAPFDVSFEGREDKTLAVTLRAEIEGILACAVRDCLVWQRDGLGSPVVVKRATSNYRGEEDVVGRFLQEELTARATEEQSLNTIFGRFKVWCEQEGESAARTATAFGRDLAEHRWTKRHTEKGNVWRPPSAAETTLETEGLKGAERSVGSIAHTRACAPVRDDSNQPFSAVQPFSPIGAALTALNSSDARATTARPGGPATRAVADRWLISDAEIRRTASESLGTTEIVTAEDDRRVATALEAWYDRSEGGAA